MKVDADEIFENIRNCQRMGKYYRNIFLRGFFSNVNFILRKIVRFDQLEIHHVDTACNVLIIFVTRYIFVRDNYIRMVNENVEI